jgi:hypothetical protein
MDLDGFVLPDEFVGEDEEDTKLVRALAVDAESFLEQFEWCRGLRQLRVGVGIGGVLAVFLARIDPDDAPEWIWVVVGDLPPAVIDAKDASTPHEALRVYTEDMRLWVHAASRGDPVEHLRPVTTVQGTAELDPDPELAKDLESRLDFIERELLGTNLPT